MCGLVGQVVASGQTSTESLRQGLKTIHHRGPDAEGFYVSPDKSVGLAHARLSIMDVEGGDQPISNEDGQIWIVANGEFYDFERIRGELEARGHRFRTRSDSEIALHLYEEYGPKCLEYLRGEFAFIIWDQRDRVLFAARDRFGIKPLFFSHRAGQLTLASEAKAIAAMGDYTRWDRATLLSCMTMQYLLPDRSIFEGVQQIPPGHYLLHYDNNVHIRPYWDLEFPKAGSERTDISDAEAIEEFRARFGEAVKLRLRADVPVACYLSGGVDSCAVLGMAAAVSSQPIDCFTICFDDPDYDEYAIAKEMAARVNARFIPINVSAADCVSHLPDAIWHAETFFVNTHVVGKYLLSRHVRNSEIKVVLGGEGSDEILAGYPHFRKDLFAAEKTGDIASLVTANLLSSGILLAEGETVSLDHLRSVLGYVPSFLETKATLGFRLHALMSEAGRAELGARDCYRVFLNSIDVSNRLSGRHVVNQSLYLWTKLAFAGYAVSGLGDRMEMAHSVEGRLPFLDHPLVEFVTKLPIRLKIRDGVEKFLLREGMRKELTETVFARRKHPFLAPPSHRGAETQLRDLINDTLRGSQLKQLGLFDSAKVGQFLDRLPSMTQNERTATEPAVMMLLSACLLQQQYGLQW